MKKPTKNNILQFPLKKVMSLSDQDWVEELGLYYFDLVDSELSLFIVSDYHLSQKSVPLDIFHAAVTNERDKWRRNYSHKIDTN